jgi:tetratricopeptide (TPR) repeat protein
MEMATAIAINNGRDLLDEAKLKATEVLQNNRPTDPILANQYKNVGNQKFAKNDWEGAYEDYSQAIQANYRDAAFYSNRSACLIQLNRPEEALEDAVFAKAIRPDWSKAYYRMAVALLAIADSTGLADADSNMTNKNDDDNGEDLFETAAMVIWKGLVLDPKNADLKILLRRCAKSGRRQAHHRRRRSRIRR